MKECFGLIFLLLAPACVEFGQDASSFPLAVNALVVGASTFVSTRRRHQNSHCARQHDFHKRGVRPLARGYRISDIEGCPDHTRWERKGRIRRMVGACTPISALDSTQVASPYRLGWNDLLHQRRRGRSVSHGCGSLWCGRRTDRGC